jgi:hypothetical protein
VRAIVQSAAAEDRQSGRIVWLSRSPQSTTAIATRASIVNQVTNSSD